MYTHTSSRLRGTMSLNLLSKFDIMVRLIATTQRRIVVSAYGVPNTSSFKAYIKHMIWKENKEHPAVYK